MAQIKKVSEVQEAYRGLLRNAIDQKDPILEEEALKGSILDYGEDAIVNLSVILVSRMGGDPDPSIYHLIRAVSILDDLSTLGMEVRFKQ